MTELWVRIIVFGVSKHHWKYGEAVKRTSYNEREVMKLSCVIETYTAK